MGIGEKIKARREELGLSQEELAHRIGLSGKSSICKAEKSQKGFTTTTLSKYASAFGCSIEYLMGFEETGLTEDERLLIERYRKAGKTVRKFVLKVLGI